MNTFFVFSLYFLTSIWLFCLFKIWFTLKRFPIPRKIDSGTITSYPFMSVIIPARNEALNIEQCLKSLSKADYPAFEIIVINDRSTDETGLILDNLKSSIPNLKVIHLHKSGENWSGKNYAIHQGIREAKGDWFLFSDADTTHYPLSLKLGLQEAIKNNTGFLTFLSRMDCQTLAEKLIQPITSGLMTLWYPIEKLNNPKSRLGFANGQYILFSRKSYEQIGGHEAVKEELLEDVALSERAKKLHIPFRVEIGIHALKTRMYNNFSSAWRGWRRIFTHLSKHDALKILIASTNLFIFGFVPFLLLLICLFYPVPATTLFLSLFTFLLSVFVRWLLNFLGKMPGWAALLYPLSILIVLGILLNSFWYILIKKKTAWRGNHY